MSRRKRKQRNLKTTVFIICEGENTEPNYFQRIKEQLESDSDYAIEIHIQDTDKSDPIGLVEEAASYSGEYNELWAVFDKDGYTKHKEAFELASSKEVNVAFSSIAFEHWVLLHFERNQTAFPKSADVIQYLTNHEFFKGYHKKGDVDIYPKIEGKTVEAIENAAWLRFVNKGSQEEIFDMNPYTDVDILVAKLLQFSKKVVWTVKAQLAQLEGLEITINYNWEGGFEVQVELKNTSITSYILNAANLNQRFYLLDHQREKIYFESPERTILIQPDQSQNFTLEVSELSEQNYLFNFETDQEKLMMLMSK